MPLSGFCGPSKKKAFEMINENISFQTVEYMQQRIEELHTENLQLKMDAASIAADERAKIVAWLRDGGQWNKPWPSEVEAEYPELANAIEAGEHLK